MNPERSAFHRIIQKISFSLVVLSLCLPLSGWSSPDPQKQYYYGKLNIIPGPIQGNMFACIGESFPLGFTVKNAVDEFPIPVSEAMVEVTDGKGSARAHVTNRAGFVRLNWPVEEEGIIRLTVNARKEWYDPAPPLTIAVRGIECAWTLKVDFHEEYAVVEDFNLVVGATTSWRGNLMVEPNNDEDYTSKVVLKGGSGEYKFYAADTLIPYHFTLQPNVSGDWNLRVEGTATYDKVTLDLYTEPVSYPRVLNFKVVDVINPNITINYMPPVATSGGNGLFLELNRLSHLTFPLSGGSVHLDSGMSCYFLTPTRSKYSLTVMLYALRGPNY